MEELNFEHTAISMYGKPVHLPRLQSWFAEEGLAKDVIASMTLGATRRFLLHHLSCFGKVLTRKKKPLTNPSKKKYEFSLTNGSLIVMLDDTQQYWKHSVPKEKNVKSPRINLTFRTIQDK
ncbi:unnamed protein product [Rotaria sordida]|uniref:Alpha-ketoglutarate-dependent dioxygenase AlkB-like domain-containing protein n=1 Tax=Rotaria sordida TaxID=392033 RepID=A0A815B308_9BILA|nr:unnamed protein product [Rotaria sordida]